MDSLRGNFDAPDFTEISNDYDLGDDDGTRDLPPAAIGQDERRMQVRAYNHWASMLGEHSFPSIEDLHPENLPDFGPYSVLLDFSTGIEDPAIQFLGDELAAECGTDGHIARLSDVPSRSLLSRITDHYLQILANQAPIGFEAEFVNQRAVTILYRGILLPYSSDNDTIDFIYGVINWKEMAGQDKADELLLEIDQAIEAEEDEPVKRDNDPVTDWADGPSADRDLSASTPAPVADEESNIRDIGGFGASFGRSFGIGNDAEAQGMPEPAFGDYSLDDEDALDLSEIAFGDYSLDDEDFGDEEGEEEANYDFASLSDHIATPTKKALSLDLDDLVPSDAQDDEDEKAGDEPGFETDLETGYETDYDTGQEPGYEPEAPTVAPAREEFGRAAVQSEAEYTPARFDEELAAEEDEVEFSVDLSQDAGLYDYLAAAREAAQHASDCEDRGRKALYLAVGQAYDFSVAAQKAPEDYAELLAECGLEAQARAPMTPVVKLVFGADYDKTRLTEYAAVLSYAHRVGIAPGGLADYIAQARGGLKGVVSAERRWRKEQAGQDIEPESEVRGALAKKLRKLAPQEFSDIASAGEEFALVMIRRTETGEVVMLGEIEQDVPLIERAARKLLG